MTTRVLALVGSLRAGSYNKQLAEAAVKYAPDGEAGAISGKPLAVIGVSNGRHGGVWANDDARKAASIAGREKDTRQMKRVQEWEG